MPEFTNIAAYQFTELSDLKQLRERLIERCRVWKLKGTILLSSEGVNLFVAGRQAEVEFLLSELRAVSGLENLKPKYSESHEQPFERMLVKIKREIIAFGVDGIDPAQHPSPKISPQELRQWLDEGRPLVLLDTRNDYEIKLGTFRNAKSLNIDHFRRFPAAVKELPAELKTQPIVMFCTGGIRCEKAGPLMLREGFENVLQLDGGILKYFEDCGREHYDGECFVFDRRVGVDPSLHESETTQCFACQSPLSIEDRNDSRFVEGLSCPYCFKSNEEQRQQVLVLRNKSIRLLTNPLPGSIPYENHRPLNVPLQYDGRTLFEFLTGIFNHLPEEHWKNTLAEGRIRKRFRTNANNRAIERPLVIAHANDTVNAGEQYVHVQPGLVEPDVSNNVSIVYEDEAILVVNKPAPLPMHPCGRFNRNTLQYFLAQVYQPQSPRPAHRLDANTSGLVLFTRTKHYAKRLQRQFDSNATDTVKKVYLARVLGHPAFETLTCELPIGEEPQIHGSRSIDCQNGLPARTDFRVIERLLDGTSMLEVIPHTGRTNQIRIHLSSLGYSICNETVYAMEETSGETQTSSVYAAQLCLLAWKIEFTHPLTNQRMSFEAEKPDWCVPSQSVMSQNSAAAMSINSN